MSINTGRVKSSNVARDVVLSWTVHLARDCPSKLIASLALVAAGSAAGYFLLGAVAAAATALVMLASVAEFVFPTKYQITTDGAACRMLFKASEIRWQNVRRYWVDDLGVKLSPLSRRSRLEAFRGVYLRFNNNQQQVIEAVKSLKEKTCST